MTITNGKAGATMPPPVMSQARSPFNEVAPAFNEAPASVNTRISWRGHDVQLTLRAESGAAVLGRLDAALTWLEAHGATPAAAGGAGLRYGAPRAAASPTNGQTAPTCPTHGRAMKAGRNGGWFCPAKLADDGGDGKPVYCRQRVTGGAQ